MRGGGQHHLGVLILVTLLVLLFLLFFPVLVSGRDDQPDDPLSHSSYAQRLWLGGQQLFSGVLNDSPAAADSAPPLMSMAALDELSRDWFLTLHAERPLDLHYVDGMETVPGDRDFMRTGVKRFLRQPRHYELFGIDAQLQRIMVEGALLQIAARADWGEHLEATFTSYVDMAGLNHRTDLRVTITGVPLVKMIRLYSRSWVRGWARPGVWEPWLERGAKFSVSDWSPTDGRFLGYTELQLPPYLGSRGLNAAIVLNPDSGLSIRFDLDLPDLLFDGVPWKLKLPSFNAIWRP